MVAVAGVEPARPCGQGILNPSRLPIPSHRLGVLHRLGYLLVIPQITVRKVFFATPETVYSVYSLHTELKEYKSFKINTLND